MRDSFAISSFIGVLMCLPALEAQSAPAAGPAPPPKIESIFPISGTRGTTFEAFVRGTNLKDARDIWFEATGMSARVMGLESEAEDARGRKADLLRVELSIGENSAGRERRFRVITPRGLSNALAVYIHEERVLRELDKPHDLPKQAQAVGPVPVAVQGQIAQVGEVDFYSFNVKAGEEIWFRTLSSEALDPALTIFKLTGSWYDPDRATRLAFSDEPVSFPGLTTEAALRHRFAEAGEYLVRVNGFWGHGGPGQDYTLLIGPSIEEMAQDDPKGKGWTERAWTRELNPKRMKSLQSRALPALAEKTEMVPVVDADAEPVTAPVAPPTIQLPSLVVGAIERPGDIDRVKFSVKEGDRVAFEVETPGKTVPLMNPLLRVIDADGVEALTNVYSMVNSNGNASKQIQAKTQYSFPRAGEFMLEIRDITATYGGPEMKYKVMVRPQVPHLGEVHIEDDCLNLAAGKAQKLSVITDQEEGFEGQVILSVEGLPEGVRVATATEVEPDTPPPTSEGKRERYRTKSQKATLLLVVDPGAAATRLPAVARVYAQPVVGGELGGRILVKKIPVMVVR
jgi:hypothetical protein